MTENGGRIALRRGPRVYALESIDNGEDLCQILFSPKTGFQLEPAHGLSQDTLSITDTAFCEHFTSDCPGNHFTLKTAPKSDLLFQ